MSTEEIRPVLSRFIIRRKDITVDDVVLDSEGLTIGRLIGNDLALNHRTVSRTHAGIKEINKEYWLFNLSGTNGTILNGELVDKTPLADDDVIQIGRYLLKVKHLPKALLIDVEMEMDAHPMEARTALLHVPQGDESSAATVMLPRFVPGQETVTPSGTKRLQGTGLLTGVLQGIDVQALEVFWQKRKREAGKIAEKTALHPRGDRRVGKAQFNWRPTFDLRKPWRKSYFSWGAVIVTLLALGALVVHDEFYSPGEISDPHSRSELSDRGIAVKANAGSCYDCHTVTASIQSNCATCHQTQTFTPAVSDAHTTAGVGCISCHGEHMGSDFRPGLVGSSMCISCHNDTYRFKGDVLGIPHGGSVGYPVENRRWTWAGLSDLEWKNKQLPDTASKYTPLQQFHMLHVAGRQVGRANCTDCHTAGLHTEEGLHQSPRSTCASCHSTSFEIAGQVIGPDCTSCHVQHGLDRNLIASTRTRSEESDVHAQNIPLIGWGGAQVIRHDETGTRWGFAASTRVGALPWYGWLAIFAALPLVGLAVMAVGSIRRKAQIRSASSRITPETAAAAAEAQSQARVADGPDFPHPVVDPILCIGCHACVEACPHDVLAIVNGVSVPVAIDQCMEDTSCMVECPTTPKACVVVNTTKVIPPRKVPSRDQRYQTNVMGIYMAGDVSGVPLIKNAINEGAQAIDSIIEDLKGVPGGEADYDVAIIGIGPAGLSATAIAKQRGLRYVAIEQDKVVSTIQNYPAGKYVFFKPDTVENKGAIELAGAGGQRENILESWVRTIRQHGLVINEDESCKDVKPQNGHFAITTERGKLKERATYNARAVLLAIGSRGTPMRLRVTGEDLKITVQPEVSLPTDCPRCGASLKEGQAFCPHCGNKLQPAQTEPFEDSKVKYKLSDPDDYVNKKCIVVGAGNSAIEAAVDLTGFKREGNRVVFTRNNEVTLVVRSDFKGDLKLGNKMKVYDCMDAGKIKVFFRTEIKEIHPTEVVLMNTRTKEPTARIPNDYIFALIGGEKPTRFLEGLGIKIG